jgi:hypothetical protein
MDDYPQQETIMINSIASTSAVQTTYAATPGTNAAPQAAANTAAAGQADGTPPAPAQSAESAATARLGDQLNAQADASRVQRAVDESAATGETGAGAEETGGEAAITQAPASAAPAGGAGGSAKSAEATDTDYIAEADTNSDKTVSDEERAAYEAKLREQNEKQAEVRAAYGQIDAAAPALDVTA